MAQPTFARPSVGSVLVVDDQQANAHLLERHLVREGFSVTTTTDGQTAIDTVHDARPDVVLLDVVMPGLSGFEVCRRLKRDPTTRLTPVVLVTALNERAHRIEGINVGADDFLSKPVDPLELKARVRSLARLKQFTDELDSAEAVIVSLAQTIEARDEYTVGHCQRLARYATALGADIGLRPDELDTLERGGFLHDIGKIGVPDSVLLKPAALTTGERAAIERHTLIGDHLCSTLNALQRVRPIVRHHHERLDGSGYPDGLRGEQVPLLARITSIVDVYDALTTTRPYRAAYPAARAYEVLRDEARRGWRQPDLVGHFISLGERGLLAVAGSAA